MSIIENKDKDGQKVEEKSHIVKLSEKPCVVRYEEKFDGFLVGTYDLFPSIESFKSKFPHLREEELQTKYKFVNNRLGSLNLLQSPPGETDKTKYQLHDVLNCDNGGVFDLSILNDKIYVAHANGHVAHYEYDDLKLKSLESICVTEDTSTLLTSIDTCTHHSETQDSSTNLLIVAGDSGGYISIIEGDTASGRLAKCISRCQVTDFGDPVWQVKFFTPSSSLSDRLILVTAEDCHWYIYKLAHSLDDDKKLQLVFKSQASDFQAGITSICLLPHYETKVISVMSNTNLNEPTPQIHNVILGSYDESLRAYQVHLDDTTCKPRVVSSSGEPVARIKGGGIWRLLNYNCANHKDNFLYIAAMYAGTYKMCLEKCGLSSDDTHVDDRPTECDRIYDHLEPSLEHRELFKEAPLHYGVDLSPSDSIACIVDFNNNCCIFVAQ